MPATITAERPDTPDALLLIDQLQTHLESFYRYTDDPLSGNSVRWCPACCGN